MELQNGGNIEGRSDSSRELLEHSNLLMATGQRPQEVTEWLPPKGRAVRRHAYVRAAWPVLLQRPVCLYLTPTYSWSLKSE